jgi:hypothetical protein
MCGKSLCRVAFEHTSPATFKEYQRHLLFSPWKNTSNYFSGEPHGGGEIASFLWLGRDGFTIPLDELRVLNATGEYAEP